MHLLYVDESGSVADQNQPFFILVGVSVFERRTHWIEQKLNAIAKRFDADHHHELELHGSPMRAGRGVWRSKPFGDRMKAIADALKEGISDEKNNGVNLFAVVLEKSALHGQDPVEYAFELLTMRFDNFLKRLHLKHNSNQRGMMLFDKSTTEIRLQTLAREFKYSGHAFGRTRNFAEVPVFLDSKASRLIQLADLAAYAVHRKYAHGDDVLFKSIAHCFDREGGVVHGLYVKFSEATPAVAPAPAVASAV
ncbi:DUF3800 domain-containing protein [Comamonas sp. E6]|uniref:DUF3800 domain-containing protein n=1 Tax=Comamonas sp. E6 TaxID=364029 RepID=UPI000633DD41|nr:DUF3800 domain-containing protein [Comamonas sp. E6]GAO71185.1 hypothetical protein CSE6_014_26220 [Comamonas sp. E6]